MSERKSKNRSSTVQSFANQEQVLILSQASTEHLHTQCNLEDNQDVEWMLEQFRGNLVIDGGLKPYEENDWKQIQIGNELVLDAIGPCNRCNVIGINQANSENVREPLQTLAKNQVQRFKFGLLAGCVNSMDGIEIQIDSPVKVTQ